jgi:hypothetical protein
LGEDFPGIHVRLDKLNELAHRLADIATGEELAADTDTIVIVKVADLLQVDSVVSHELQFGRLLERNDAYRFIFAIIIFHFNEEFVAMCLDVLHNLVSLLIT